MVADARDVASAVPKSIFRYYGNSIIGIAPIADIQASASSTWTAINTNGYTIPAGTQVGVRAAGDELIAFQVAFDVVIPPGSVTTTVGQVQLLAVLPGDQANGFTGAAELIDPIDWIASINIPGLTGGGVTAETDDSYLNRLAAQLQLLSPRPILPQDFATMARSIPGVARALAVDGYNPDTATYNNERYVTVAVVDAAGEPVSGVVKGQVDALLQSEREINFIVRVIDPTYTFINVSVAFVLVPGQDATVIQNNVIAALQSYLSPASWGGSQGDEGSSVWSSQPNVRYLELATVVNNVFGVDYITSLTFAANGTTLGTSDVSLGGVAGLPRPNTITATGT
jgi:hypothetical protein